MAKTWAEQSADLAHAWSEAQTSFWEGWMETAAEIGRTQEGITKEWLGRWQEASQDVLDRLGASGDGVPRAVVERLFSAEEIYLRFLDSSIAYLRVVAPRIDAGEDWVDLLRAYSEQLKDELVAGPSRWLQAEDLAATSENLPELWKLYTLEIQKAWAPWAESLVRAPWDVRDLAAGDRNAFSRMFNMFMDTWEQTYGRYLSAPAIGYTREMNEKITRGFEAWVDLRRAAVEFQMEVLNTGGRSLEDLLRELVERGERGETITTFKGLFDLWVTTAERTFSDLFSTEGFARLQGKAVNAAMAYKLREREITEELMKALDLPTRSEIDEVHRHVHDVRIELRYAKRDLAEANRQLQETRDELAAMSAEVKAAGQAGRKTAAGSKAPARKRTRKTAPKPEQEPEAKAGGASAGSEGAGAPEGDGEAGSS